MVSETKKKSGEGAKSFAASSQLEPDLVCPEEAFIKLLQLVRTIQALSLIHISEPTRPY